MAHIETVPESEAAGELATLYKKYGRPDGTVDEVLKVHSLNPESLEAHCALYVQSLHRQSPLTRAEREILGVVVSRLNGCAYCLEHHAQGLRRLVDDDRQAMVNKLVAGDGSGLTARESAMAAYAERLTRTPGSIERSDVDALRAAGLTDREILDAAQVIGYFAYANRIVLGLGAELEGESALGYNPTDVGTR